MSLQKLICTQCGSNELKVVSSTVFECESCGTILKEEKPKEIPQPPPIQKPKEKPFRSKRQFTVLDEPGYGDESMQEQADSKQAATFVIVLVVAAIFGLILIFAS